jgi:cell division protein ZapA
MAEKNSVEVVIDGKVYHLGGYESEEYMQKIANFVNNKLEEVKKLESFPFQSMELQHILMYINLGDEYFKAKKKTDTLQEEVAMKDRLMYDMKHELIDAQLTSEASEKTMQELQKENTELKRKIGKLETQLETLKKSEK